MHECTERERVASPTLHCSSVDGFGSEWFQMVPDLCPAYCSFKQAVTAFKCMRVRACVCVCINAQTTSRNLNSRMMCKINVLVQKM